jgi:translation elongation factor EF-4
MVKVSIIVPEGEYHWLLVRSNQNSCTKQEYLGELMDLCYSRRASELDHRYIDGASTSARVMMTCEMPLSEIVTDFHSQLKSRSSGYASCE